MTPNVRLLLLILISLQLCNSALATAEVMEHPPANLSYIDEITLYAETGGNPEVALKWNKPLVNINVYGPATQDDLAYIDEVITDFNMISETTKLTRNGTGHDIGIIFCKASEFNQVSTVVISNSGQVWTWWTNKNQITRSTICINDQMTGALRNHTIREELTQGCGFLNDSWRYPNSIFYQGYSTVTRYSGEDIRVIWESYHR